MKTPHLLLAAILTAALFPAAIPAAAAPVPAADTALGPFGIGSCHVNNRSAQDNARWIPQMTAIGLKYYRTAHTGWEAVEPKEGNWTWDALDKQMDYLTEQHLEFGGILYGNARWNTKDRPGTLPINNLPAW